MYGEMTAPLGANDRYSLRILLLFTTQHGSLSSHKLFLYHVGNEVKIDELNIEVRNQSECT